MADLNAPTWKDTSGVAWMGFFPFPDPILSPNKQTHWAKKSGIKKKLREECRLIASKCPIPWNKKGNIKLTVRYWCPHGRADLDNIHASFKSGFDGIADGFGVNDKWFRPFVIEDFIAAKDSKPWVDIMFFQSFRERER